MEILDKQLKIASWNLEGRLSDTISKKRGTPEHILDGIDAIDADILFCPDAFETGAVAPGVFERLGELGYSLYQTPYDDDLIQSEDGRKSNPSMLLLSRKRISVQTVRLGGTRNALLAEVPYLDQDAPLCLFGLHLSDNSEARRFSEAESAVAILNQHNSPKVALGDFNAVSSNTLGAHLLRNKFAQAISRLALPDLAPRAIAMATGKTMALFNEKAQLFDADTRATATPKLRGKEYLPSVRLLQLDHTLGSGDIAINNFVVHKDGGSDHRAISANISSIRR